MSVVVPRITRVKVIARPAFDQLVDALDSQHASLCAASSGMLETIAYLAGDEDWGDDQSSLSCFLAGRYHLSSGTAWEWVRVSGALRRLPAIREAYARGELSWDQVRAVTRFACPETDEALAREAPGMTISALSAEARRLERRKKENLSARRCRGARMDWDESKQNLHVEADLPGERGAAFEAAVSRRAEQVEVEDDVVDPKEARLADALVELVASSGEGSPQTTLVIHADASIVVGEDSGTTGAAEGGAIGASRVGGGIGRMPLAETETGVQLHDEAVRRLACDASVEWVLENGRPVGIGRRGRLVPGWMARHLRFRDPECRFEGCSRRMNLVVHHIVPWARGGPTDLDNLVRLCGRHHRLVHEGGWVITGHPDAHLRFQSPDRRGPPRSRLPSLMAAALR
jgi:hypothetical protein